MIERVDIARASPSRSSVKTLGLELETEGESDVEFRCGQVTGGNALMLHRRLHA